MAPELFNLTTLVNGIVPAMVGVPPGGGDWIDAKFPAGAPVLEIVGDRASGKSEARRVLSEGYVRLVPTASVDLTEGYTSADPVDRDRLDTDNSSPVTDLLFTLVYQLERRPDGSRHTPSFDRLRPALLLLTLWDPEPTRWPAGVKPAQVATAEAKLRGILAQHTPDPRRLDESFKDWIELSTRMAGALFPQFPWLDPVLRAMATTMVQAHGHRRAARWEQWWRGRLRTESGDAVQRLFGLVQRFRNRDDSRMEAERHLIAAFLADIDGAYGALARKTRHPPLVLLDNVDEFLDGRFLTPFVSEYRHGGGAGRPAVRPVVVATSLGNGDELPSVTEPEPWKEEALRPPRTWRLRMGIPRTTDAEVRQMLGNVDYSEISALPKIIVRLSGGRTGSARLLADAAAEGLRADIPPLPLLALPSRDTRGAASRDVAADILEQAVPDANVRDLLVNLASALDESAAVDLRRRLGDTDAAVRVRELVNGTLALSHWNRAPGGGPSRLIADRALRAVLLHRLRAISTRFSWDRIQRILAARYNPGHLPLDSVLHEPEFLHHALAAGWLDSVVLPALHHRYLDRAPAGWLRDVNLIATAPPEFDGYRRAPAAPGVPACAVCATPGTNRTVHAAIRGLLVTVWRLSDPDTEPPRRHNEADVIRVENALKTLAADYDERNPRGAEENAYVDAVAGWPEALLGLHQAPDLPTHEGASR